MIIYKLTSPSGKIYIGQTRKTLDQRWRQHQQVASKRRFNLHYALSLYHPSEWLVEQIENCSNQDQLNEREIFWIDYYNSYSDGYNMTLGGDGGGAQPKSASHKEAISEARKKYFMTEEGKIWKDELSKQFVENNPGETKGKPAYNRGKKHSDETRNRMSLQQKKRIAENSSIVDNLSSKAKQRWQHGVYNNRKPIEWTEERRAKWSEMNKGKIISSNQKEAVKLARQKTFNVLFPDGTVHQVINLRQFAKDHNIDQGNLASTIKHSTRKHKGYRVLSVVE